MLFLEEIAAAQRNIKLQIFATDIDEDAVDFAREGLYPASIEADVSPARLTRFFTKEDRGYRVSRELRAAIVFSVHDLIADAPFSRLDLISCRNLLIYLRPEVQQKVLSLFHFALREGGILFLGTSETVGDASDHFEPISKKQRIYRHIGRSRPGEVELPLGRGEAARSLWLRPARPAATPRTNMSDLAQRLLLESYAPASVLVNRKHQGTLLLWPHRPLSEAAAGRGEPGPAGFGARGAPPGDQGSAREGEPRAGTGGRHRRPGEARWPLRRGDRQRPAREERRRGTGSAQLPRRAEAGQASKRQSSCQPMPRGSLRLEQELDATRKELENAIRDRETAEEEIRAINEEAMSVNEEFQTTNEELETSKEELQSLNEELTALNSQLQETLDQHQTVANDLENILNSADRRDTVPRRETQHPLLHPRGEGALQRHRHRHRPAARRSRAPFRRRKSPSRRQNRAFQSRASDARDRGRERRLVHLSHPALSDKG